MSEICQTYKTTCSAIRNRYDQFSRVKIQATFNKGTVFADVKKHQISDTAQTIMVRDCRYEDRDERILTICIHGDLPIWVS
jgi:hypothetical protein